ncbi:hypothetical protein D3C72_1585110 [compost metagenome]
MLTPVLTSPLIPKVESVRFINPSGKLPSTALTIPKPFAFKGNPGYFLALSCKYEFAFLISKAALNCSPKRALINAH